MGSGDHLVRLMQRACDTGVLLVGVNHFRAGRHPLSPVKVRFVYFDKEKLSARTRQYAFQSEIHWMKCWELGLLKLALATNGDPFLGEGDVCASPDGNWREYAKKHLTYLLYANQPSIANAKLKTDAPSTRKNISDFLIDDPEAPFTPEGAERTRKFLRMLDEEFEPSEEVESLKQSHRRMLETYERRSKSLAKTEKAARQASSAPSAPSIDNEWRQGDVELVIPPLPPEYIGAIGCRLEEAIFDPRIGQEVYLLVLDTLDQARMFTKTHPFNIFANAGFVRTSQGGVAYIIWTIAKGSPNETVTEQFLNPDSAESIRVLSTVGAQCKLKVLIVDHD